MSVHPIVRLGAFASGEWQGGMHRRCYRDGVVSMRTDYRASEANDHELEEGLPGACGRVA
jgi:hypothetical protein